MDEYKRLYYFLFNAITDALEAMDAGYAPEATEMLKDSRREAEEMYIQWADWQRQDEEEPGDSLLDINSNW